MRGIDTWDSGTGGRGRDDDREMRFLADEISAEKWGQCNWLR